ncbi:MAG TPA: GNAT family N-acetyltransferase [Sphingomicrobium sp.]|jgi:phosphinothricin acetyltransferase|nr:GNAT family N-acetyltransferase [Sphingomicrobium sp.]
MYLLAPMTATVRIAGPKDAAAIAAIYRPYVLESRFTFEIVPPDADDIEARMMNPLHPWLVAESARRVIGYASTAPMRNRAAYRWSVETGIYLEPEAQGRGVARTLLQSHLELLEERGFVTAIAGIALPNDASVALHERLGFVLAGIERGVGFKLGQWVDVARWQRDLAPRTAAPLEPLTGPSPSESA